MSRSTLEVTGLGRGLLNDQPLKLGIFGSNLTYGQVMSSAKTSFQLSWEHVRGISTLADRIGLDAVVPVGRWRGFGGRLDIHGESFETYSWASAIAEATEQITVVSTSHLPTVHPVVAAKAATTIDHISGGRFALNLVMGWFSTEMAMFGAPQRQHDDRYAYGQEWLDILVRLWTDAEPFDHHGEFFDLTEARAWPKPVQGPRPLLLNAGSSSAGVNFSARNVDINFTTIDDLEGTAAYVRVIKDMARREYGREVRVMAAVFMICRPTEAEARSAWNHIIEHADWEGARNVMSELGINSQSFESQLSSHQERFIAGWGGYPVVGSPEQVAEELGRISEAGLDGVIFGALDYMQELEIFGAEVLPLLRQSGLRH